MASCGVSNDWVQKSGLGAGAKELWHYKTCKKRLVCTDKRIINYEKGQVVNPNACAPSPKVPGAAGPPPAAAATLANGTCTIVFPAVDKVRIDCTVPVKMVVTSTAEFGGERQEFELGPGSQEFESKVKTQAAGTKFEAFNRDNGKLITTIFVPPMGVTCTPSSTGDYTCNAKISSEYDLGAATPRTSWQDCRSACNGKDTCKGWTFTPDKQCQLKTKTSTVFQQGFVSGPRSGRDGGSVPASGTGTTSSTTPTTTPSPSSTTTTPAPAAEENVPWYKKKSPLFDLEWWVVAAAGGVLLLLLCGCSMMMMVSMSSE